MLQGVTVGCWEGCRCFAFFGAIFASESANIVHFLQRHLDPDGLGAVYWSELLACGLLFTNRGLLAKLRYHVRTELLRTVYFAIFNSTTYGLNSIKNRAASDWNQISKNLNTADKPQLIKSLREYIFNSYN